MYNVTDPAFRPYGRVLPMNTSDFVEAMQERPAVPHAEATSTVYDASLPDLEALPIFKKLEAFYGELPIQLGHCSGWNEKLNALEYHRSSEVDIAATDLVLLVAKQQDIDPSLFTLETSKVEAFFVPKGTAVELYATTLHFAPCRKGEEFRCGVALPRGTNEAIDPSSVQKEKGEARLYFARNKWLISHKEGRPATRGAWVGLVGENIHI